MLSPDKFKRLNKAISGYTDAPLERTFWTGQGDLPSYNPHSFRNMLVAEMYQRGLSIAAFKAGSQNLGHESALTTLTSYGKIPLEEQGRLIREGFARTQEPE